MFMNHTEAVIAAVRRSAATAVETIMHDNLVRYVDGLLPKPPDVIICGECFGTGIYAMVKAKPPIKCYVCAGTGRDAVPFCEMEQ
jgi:hypothetical protein